MSMFSADGSTQAETQDIQLWGTPLTLTGAFDRAMGAVGSRKSTVNRRGDATVKTTRFEDVRLSFWRCDHTTTTVPFSLAPKWW